MTPRPIHRWKSFWFGLLTLIFLGGAWERSYRYEDAIGRSTGLFQGWWLSQRGGAIWYHVTWSDILPPFSPPVSGVYHSSEPLPPWPEFRPGWFPPLWQHTSERSAIDVDDYAIAHWFLMLLFLIPWSAFLAWRWWRLRKRQRQQRALTNSPDLTS